MSDTPIAEVWKSIPGYEGYYEVSNLGRIRSVTRMVRHNCGGLKIVRGKIRDLGNNRERPTICLYKKGKYKNLFVHKLVLLAFVGPCPDGMECCHNDGDHTNNVLSNLRWGTPSSNQQDRFKHGTHCAGARNENAAFTNEEILKIEEMWASGKYTKTRIAHKFNVTYCTIWRILSRRSYKIRE